MTESPVRRTILLAVLAFGLGLLGMGVGVGQLQFLWSAYHHGGL